MKKILITVIFLIVFCAIGGFVLYKNFLPQGDPMKQIRGYNMKKIWEYNQEPNRDAATTLLDCAVLINRTYRSNSFTPPGYVSESDLSDLKDLSNLYAENGNIERHQWLDLLIQQLKVIVDSYEPYYYTPREYDKKWEGIEKLIVDNNLPAAIEQSKNYPFLSAKLGEHFAAINQKNDAIQYYKIALTQLNHETDNTLRYETLRRIIMGLIKLDEDSEAIRIYRDNKKNLFNFSLEMTKAFVEKNDYDSAFNMLDEDSWSLDKSLISIAKGYIKEKERKLNDEHRKLIATIVMQYIGASNSRNK